MTKKQKRYNYCSTSCVTRIIYNYIIRRSGGNSKIFVLKTKPNKISFMKKRFFNNRTTDLTARLLQQCKKKNNRNKKKLVNFCNKEVSELDRDTIKEEKLKPNTIYLHYLKKKTSVHYAVYNTIFSSRRPIYLYKIRIYITRKKKIIKANYMFYAIRTFFFFLNYALRFRKKHQKYR